MSLKHSVSTTSTASSAVMSNMPPNEETIDPSNAFYNDKQNYEIIFSNDSRFFDTSLHLFRSYRDRGYIKIDTKKPKRHSHTSSSALNTLKTKPNGFNSGWRQQPAGFSTNHTFHTNPNRLSNKPPFLRDDAHSVSQRSDSSSLNSRPTRMKRENSPMVVPYQDPTMTPVHPTTYSASSDDSDIIVTRL